MHGKCIGKILLICLMSVAMLFSLSVPPQAEVFARTIEEIKEEQKALEEQKAQLDAETEALQGDIDKQQEYLDAIFAEQKNLELQIDGLNHEIAAYDEQIKAIEATVSAEQAQIDEKVEVLKERLKAIYVMGEASTVEILLNCESLLDFSEKSELLQAISKHDLELIAELKTVVDSVSDDIALVESYKQVVADNKTELEEKITELSDLYVEAEKVMQDLGISQEELHGEAYDIETQMESNLEELEQIKIETGVYIGTDSFIWPLPGYTYLTSYWGDGRNHKGIDIADYGVYGAPVVAADSGVVTWAVHSGWGGGYGLSVWIDHGNGYTTRYAHFCETVVNEGDYVEQGQVIGYVGNTGDSYGAHLHYEVRCNGVACDPMQWYY